MAGFAVFRQETTVDFAGADFFALVGPTGAGKSTVLDAICFALYGTVPRWVDRRSVSNALAPSCPEARVRLIFEASGRRYAATRVVRRVGRAGTRVEQAHAGLERLPDDFDPATLDARVTELGDVLAGTPTEMETAIVEAVGLPYEQFVTCVVLPQGQFAQFLHAKGAQRQQILVNLLGLHVYERVRERAGQLQRDAEQQATTLVGVLEDLSDVDDAALQAATGRLELARGLTTDVDGVLPELETARVAATEVRRALERLDAEIGQLTGVRPPADVTALAATVEKARSDAERAAAEAMLAEDTESALRDELSALPDPATLRRSLDGYAERDRLRAEADGIAETIGVAETELTAAREALVEAEDGYTRADAELARAGAEDLAADLRVHLAAGEPCPVCRQPVESLPDDTPPARLAEARAALAAAREHRDKADRTVRDLEVNLTRTRAHGDHLSNRIADLDQRLAGHDGPAAFAQRLAEVDAVTDRLNQATAAVRRARGQQRLARDAEASARKAEAEAWREFDQVRDGLATLGPPPVDRDDLGTAWRCLAEWAVNQSRLRAGQRGERVPAAERARADVERVRSRLDELFVAAALKPPTDGEYARAAAVAVERAEGELRWITERREQAARLREQCAAYQRQGLMAKTLAGHLKANMFERWLLEEALDLLVAGASEILRELSGGQYDLVHDKGDFAVVDHHDADLRRAVRTLSGGETFQASLALALALSEQLAGMSTTATSLESIVLDEGFGTLDAATLDTVAATLENLAARGDRMVGVVTHVPALAERIPVRFEVSKDARTARVERVTS
jgi:exonuclease SbcC